MYVTRPLSMYRKSPSTLSVQTPDAPFSGYLVITDEEAEAEDSFCFGICRRERVKKLPFPQDRIMTVVHSVSQYEEKTTKVWFLPVLDRPLSSNRYYVIRAKGKHKGKAFKSSREEDILTCCFSEFLSDRNPRHFNLKDVYQQFKIHRLHAGGFSAESVAPNGIASKFLRSKGWKLRSSRSRRLPLAEALGLDATLRAHLPAFDFPVFTHRSDTVIVGKWYCPFIFVRERMRAKQQMNESIFYTMTLEQWWEEIYGCINVNAANRVVSVDVDVQREIFLVAGHEAEREHGNDSRGFVWFRVPVHEDFGRVMSVGLSLAIVEQMRWLQEAGGWSEGGEREVRVQRAEEIRSESGWQKFSYYMLVESFALRRMDGNLVWKCNFRHTNTVRCKWE